MSWPEYAGLRRMQYINPGDPGTVTVQWRVLVTGSGSLSASPSLDIALATPWNDPSVVVRDYGEIANHETGAPTLPWVNPPIGDTLGSTLLEDLDRLPDYYTLWSAATVEWTSGEDAPEVGILEDVSDGINEAVVTIDTALVAQMIGWWRPTPPVDLDPLIVEELGDEGTRLLWPWTATFPTLSVGFSSSGDFNYAAEIRITPYWLPPSRGGFMAVL